MPVLDRAQQIGLYVVLCFLAVLLAVVGASLVPASLVIARTHPAPVPSVPATEPLALAAATAARRISVSYGVLLAMVGNYLLCCYGGRAARTLTGGALPALAWLAVAMYVGAGRAEGDVVLTNSLAGVGFLVLGTLAAAVGVARSLRRPRRATTPAAPLSRSA
ncbi:MAG: DUF6113 family protein [Mycobacteriales bacterium]|nr:hypothetical protein [Frankia sp.]